MKSDRRVPVAIVGGGASGTILAAQLAMRGVDSALIDGSGRVGRGVAYSTTEPVHLLNVPAEGMSAVAGDPDHFANRFAAEGGEPGGFAQRRLFGRYLGEILDQAIDSGHTQVVAASAVGAQRTEGRWRIELNDGTALDAAAVALAIGNQEPEPLLSFNDAQRRYLPNPWGSEARAAVRELSESGGDVLLIGTGLTMVDLALSLDAAGFGGSITALSRRGQVPRSHADFEPAPVEANEVPHGRLSETWRWLRRRSAAVGWRAAIDSLRPHSHGLWQSMDADEQRRFLRHARAWWDVHRHRIAPEVAATIKRMIAEGRLRVMAGRVLSASESSDAIEVEIRKRGAESSQQMTFAYAINCTGPLHAIERSCDPLIRAVLDGNEAVPDQLGIGLQADEKSRVGERLWALGPLTKGRYWEIIAVPDIREQAAVVADDIAQELQA